MPSFARRYALASIAAFFWSAAAAEPTVTVDSVPGFAGSQAVIPIDFQNDGTIVGLQIDLRLPIGQISSVDTSNCFAPGVSGAGSCARLDPPNDDIVRYAIATSDSTPLPSGRFADLPVVVKSSATNGPHPLDLLANVSLAGDADAEDVPLAVVDGTLFVFFGQSASTSGPSPTEAPTLFGSSDFVPSASSRPAFSERFRIRENLEVIARNPNHLNIRLPDGDHVRVARTRFVPRKGFVKRVGTDEFLPDPRGTPSERSYHWYGSGNHTELRVTVTNGFVAGSIRSGESLYKLSGDVSSDVYVSKVDRAFRPPPDLIPIVSKTGIAEPIPAKDTGGIGTPTEIDVLVMYTAAAVEDAGTLGNLQAEVDLGIDNLNDVMIDSLVGPLAFHLTGLHELTGFVPSGNTSADATVDLQTLQSTPAIRSLRDGTQSDVVITMLRNFQDQGEPKELFACGATFGHNRVCSAVPEQFPCSIAEGYEDWAYSWVSIQCANLPLFNSLPHEIGHTLGLHHQEVAAIVIPSENSFPWSYGHSGTVVQTQEVHATLMWVPPQDFSDLPEIQELKLSSPLLELGEPPNTIPAGINEVAENARTVGLLAPFVANYRGIIQQQVFKDGYE